MQNIGQEEWIGFRGKAYKKVMDFILKWQEKLTNTSTSPLTIKIHNELEKLKVILHWKIYFFIVFGILNR